MTGEGAVCLVSWTNSTSCQYTDDGELRCVIVRANLKYGCDTKYSFLANINCSHPALSDETCCSDYDFCNRDIDVTSVLTSYVIPVPSSSYIIPVSSFNFTVKSTIAGKIHFLNAFRTRFSICYNTVIHCVQLYIHLAHICVFSCLTPLCLCFMFSKYYVICVYTYVCVYIIYRYMYIYMHIGMVVIP